MAIQHEGSKSSFEDSPIEAEKERMPFDTVPNANTRIDQGEEPKEFGPIKTNSTENHDERPNTLVPTRSRISTRSQRSYAGADGYTQFAEDSEEQTGSEAKEEGENGEIIVTWEGEDDPMSPRSISHARKWLIVLILSASSLCVYVDFHVMKKDSRLSSNICRQSCSETVVSLSPDWHSHMDTTFNGRRILSSRLAYISNPGYFDGP